MVWLGQITSAIDENASRSRRRLRTHNLLGEAESGEDDDGLDGFAEEDEEDGNGEW